MGLRSLCGTGALLLALSLGALVAPAPARASQIVDRNVADVTLRVTRDSRTALVEYTKGAVRKHVLAWGAMNAYHPTRSRPQTKLKLDYTGGWGRFRKVNAYRQLRPVCLPYDGPALPWLVAACRAPDGSYWALQSWQRMLPNLGHDPWLPEQAVWELHLSHWSGPLPQLEIHLDWVMTQKARHLFGRLTYLGQPVHGFSTTSVGNPLDTYGRNIYLDVLNAPAYGPGWRRENSFLAQNPNGNFCYGFYAHAPYAGYPAGTRGAGHGERYRATVIGPGVLPDVSWEGADLGSYDPYDPAKVSYEQSMNSLGAQYAGGGRLCRQK